MADSIHPIRQYRHKQTPPLPLRTLAAQVGITKVSLSRIETGKQEPSPELWQRLSQETGIPMRELCPKLAAMFETAP